MRRLCDPYITTTILEDTFGELAHEVASKYMVEYEKGRFRLRDEYARCTPVITCFLPLHRLHQPCSYAVHLLCLLTKESLSRACKNLRIMPMHALALCALTLTGLMLPHWRTAARWR